MWSLGIQLIGYLIDNIYSKSTPFGQRQRKDGTLMKTGTLKILRQFVHWSIGVNIAAFTMQEYSTTPSKGHKRLFGRTVVQRTLGVWMLIVWPQNIPDCYTC